MPSVTRHPTGQDLACLICLKADNIDIDHVVNRGMGGSKERDVPENKVPLCRGCHQAKTNGVLETNVYTGAGEEHIYYQWRRNVDRAPWQNVPVEISTRYKCLVLSAAAEAVGGGPRLPPPKYSTLKSREKPAVLDDGSSAGAASAGGADRAGSSKAGGST